MYSVRRFGVVRTATIVAVMYMIIVAVFVIPIALIAGIAGAGFGGASQGGAALLGLLFFGAIAAIFYGAVGWVFTAIACLLYNFAAGIVGGIHIQLEAVAPPAVQAVPAGWGAPTAATAPPTIDPPAG